MPASPPTRRRPAITRNPRASIGQCAPLLALRANVLRAGVVLLLLLLASGCQVLRNCRVSEESISAARQLSLQAMDAQQKGRWDQAEQLYVSAVQRCPKDDRARYGYAEALWHRGAQQEAVAHMEEAVKLSGNDPERLVQLGRMYLERGELHRADVRADKALASNHQLAKAWALKGDIQEREGKKVEALASFHRALAYQSHYPEVQLAVAELYIQQDRSQRALATLQALATEYPRGEAPPNVLFREGLVLRKLGRYSDAARCLAEAAGRGEPSTELLYELAQTQSLAGDSASARLTAAAVLAREPNHPGCQQLKDELENYRPQMAAAIQP